MLSPGTLDAATVEQRAARVRLVALDVDGVLTDGRLYFGARSEALKAFHARDGLGLELLRAAGIELAFITGRSSTIVATRARELGIGHVLQGQRDKHGALSALATAAGLSLEACAYMGDDWPDLAVLAAVGLAATVADAAEEVRQAAHWVAPLPGGHGAVRALASLILRAQGHFEPLLAAARRPGVYGAGWPAQRAARPLPRP